MPKTTERPMYLDDLTPFDAASRIGEFIGAPQRSGPWEIDTFTVSSRDAEFDRIKSYGDGGGRFTPAGTYLRLSSDDLRNVSELSHGVMMSNTPDELNDHKVAWEHAQGRVLVSGLGLGCVLSGLLTLDGVTVTVIEKDPDVIRLIGPGYANDPRVEIVEGDVLTYEWPDDARWDYAWHDIWQHISAANLTPEKAEFGVSYQGVFQRYAERVPIQHAWAFDLAVMMEECHRRADEKSEAMAEAWKSQTKDERIDTIIGFQSTSAITKALGIDHDIAVLRAMYESNPDHWATIERAASKDEAQFLPDSSDFREEVMPDLPGLVAGKAQEFGVAESYVFG